MMHDRTMRIWGWALVGVLWSAAAWGQSAETKAAANALFDEGRRLIKAGHTAEACGKFEASIAMLPQLGVRLNLADCYERSGLLASAWAEFREAASFAARLGDAREAFARQRMAALAPRVPKLVIQVAATSPPALVVERDGAPVPRAALGTEVPVNPGPHTVKATAEGRVLLATSVTAVEARTTTVEIPASPAPSPEPPPAPVPARAPPPAPAPARAPPPAPPPAASAAAPKPAPPRITDEVRLVPVDTDPGRGRRRLGLVVGASGAAVTAGGLVFGYLAMSKVSGAKDRGDCDEELRCNAAGVADVDSARTWGNLSTVTVGVGLAAVAAGAVLYLTAPKGPRVTVSVAPGGLVVAGRF